MTIQDNDRRRFTRIPFNAQTRLSQGEHQLDAQLLDISLQGLLAKLSAPCPLSASTPVQVTIELDDETAIRMETELAHQQGDTLGLHCTGIEVESIAHLRRLIELNLGDANAAARELTELAAP